MFPSLRIVSVLAALAFTCAAALSLDGQARGKCYNGVYMIIAHGTNEEGKGSMGYISDAVELQIPQSHTVAIHYPSTMDNYSHSEGTGVIRMKQAIRHYVNLCGRRSKIMLLGYSQGAHVITDTLSGGTFPRSGAGPQYSVPIANKFSKHIFAVLQFGDPSFTVDERWDAGTSNQSGVVTLSTDQLNNLRGYSHVLRSYCDKLDPYCASGEKNRRGFDVHGGYVQRYASEATSWLVRKWYR